jgi:WS/DGAT/MGAT family acyltransferase
VLAEQVARIVSRPLDRARPLWELYLIHGLAGGRSAVLTKFHHAAVDGASVAEIFSVLLDAAPEGRAVQPPNGAIPTERKPGQLSMLARGLAGMPRHQLRTLHSLPRVLPHIDTVPTIRNIPGVATVAGVSRQVVRSLPGTSDSGLLEGERARAPRTSLNGRISPHRRTAFTRLSLPEVKQIKDAYGVTVNDVVIAICAGALREWMTARGELPDAPLVAMIPVSVRTPDQAGTFGNRVSTMAVAIPTDEPDPERRLRRAHQTMRSAKERHEAVPATILQDANHFIPPALFARAARVTSIVATRHPGEGLLNAAISNVPGSPTPLYMAGARLEALYPISAILDGCALNITVMSYCGGLDFGVVVDRDIVDDAWPLTDALSRAQAELVALVQHADSNRT